MVCDLKIIPLPLTPPRANSSPLNVSSSPSYTTDHYLWVSKDWYTCWYYLRMSAVTSSDWFSGSETQDAWSGSWSTLCSSSLASCWLWLSSEPNSESSSSSLREIEKERGKYSCKYKWGGQADQQGIVAMETSCHCVSGMAECSNAVIDAGLLQDRIVNHFTKCRHIKALLIAVEYNLVRGNVNMTKR